MNKTRKKVSQNSRNSKTQTGYRYKMGKLKLCCTAKTKMPMEECTYDKIMLQTYGFHSVCLPYHKDTD